MHVLKMSLFTRTCFIYLPRQIRLPSNYFSIFTSL